MNRQAAADAKLSEPDAELDAIARVVVDASFEVHRVLGPGFLESMYEEALAFELSLRGVALQRQVPLPLAYKAAQVGSFRMDMVVSGRLVLELKAVESLLPLHLAQLLAYLKATRQPLGLLINFNVRFLRQGIRRVVLSP